MGKLKKFYKTSLPEMGVAFLFETAKNLLSRRTVVSTLRAQVRWLATGSREKPYRSISSVEYYSDKIMELLHNKGVAPRSVCIDGLPGSGKSSLGRSLAKKTGLEWRTLYWQELKEPFPFEEGLIYENIRLIRTQSIESFDMLIYLDCSIDAATSRVMERDRDGILIDLLDFPMLKKIGDLTFEMADGEEFRIAQTPLRIKFRPKGGYRDIEKLKERLKAGGRDVEGFSKEELLFIYCYGKPREGIFPYIKKSAYNKEILSGLSEGLKRVIVARYFT